MKRHAPNRLRKNIRTEIDYNITFLDEFETLTKDEEKLKPKVINVTDLDEFCWRVFPDCDKCNPNKKVIMLQITFRENYSEMGMILN